MYQSFISNTATSSSAQNNEAGDSIINFAVESDTINARNAVIKLLKALFLPHLAFLVIIFRYIFAI